MNRVQSAEARRETPQEIADRFEASSNAYFDAKGRILPGFDANKVGHNPIEALSRLKDRDLSELHTLANRTIKDLGDLLPFSLVINPILFFEGMDLRNAFIGESALIYQEIKKREQKQIGLN